MAEGELDAHPKHPSLQSQTGRFQVLRAEILVITQWFFLIPVSKTTHYLNVSF